MPARCAARTFSLRPPIGGTRPRSVISPVIATSWRPDAGEHRDERREHGHAGGGPVPGHRARGDVDVDVGLLEEVLRDAELLRVRTDVRERACADSFMTSPSWPVSWSLPVPYIFVPR